MNNIFIKSFFLLILIYFAITVVVYLFQRKLLYHPFSPQITGKGLIHNFETINFKTSDNFELKGWFHLKNSNKKTILFLHGNAGNLDNRIDKLNFLGNMDINFLIIAWRGYSGNPGKPSETGLYKDALGGIEWLNKKGISNDRIILYGESLGTAITTEIAQNENFAGIILEAPFTSMVDMGQKIYPIFPVKFLLKDKYESKNKIKNIKSPILVLHGRKDKIVPFYMGEKIFEIANNPKFKYFTDSDDHMMNFDKKLVNEIDLFIKNLN
jgi:Prolyl oligopeptidase family.